jgi:hypothetical protein
MGTPLPYNQFILISLCSGIAIAVVFLVLYLLKKRSPPDFLDFIGVIFSVVGTFMGFEFGRIALLAAPRQLGLLANHKVFMVIGALAIIWYSVHNGIRKFYLVWTEEDGSNP